ncbi:MAG: dihydropteroate synthase [Candidatus Acetothermia bacterium]
MNVIEELTTKNRVLIMGILNVTPDSFSDGGEYNDADLARERGIAMVNQGADIIDVGGESTRPGAGEVPPEEEMARTIPVIEEIRERSDVLISIDTRKASVAERALDAGADIVNDVSALRSDPELGELVAERGVPIVLMHMQGTPESMQENPTYDDPVGDIIDFLRERTAAAVDYGITREKIIIDPGIGFGKTVAHNYEILRRLEEFQVLGSPLLLGTSRKSFIGATLDLPVDERIEGTIASNVIGLLKGAKILRVHDVKEVFRATRVAMRCR